MGGGAAATRGCADGCGCSGHGLRDRRRFHPRYRPADRLAASNHFFSTRDVRRRFGAPTSTGYPRGPCRDHGDRDEWFSGPGRSTPTPISSRRRRSPPTAIPPPSADASHRCFSLSCAQTNLTWASTGAEIITFAPSVRLMHDHQVEWSQGNREAIDGHLLSQREPPCSMPHQQGAQQSAH